MTTAVKDPVDLSIRHFVDAWRTMCAGARGYAEEAVDGVHYVFSGIPIPFFNVALMTGHDVAAATLSASGQGACDWASKHGVPWLFVITREALGAGTDAGAALDAYGLAPLMPLTGMIAQHVAPPSNVPPELQLVHPRSDDGCAAVVDVNGLAYGMDLEEAKGTIGKQRFWSGHFPALGMAEGTPVSAAAVMMVNGYRYVALVATDPAHQRRGYADAVMRHALELSGQVHGQAPSTLHATAAGRPIYERMGYATLAEHTVFIEKKFLTGH
jgi:ribosomal protein S18 acetylase RimI-like enzyme